MIDTTTTETRLRAALDHLADLPDGALHVPGGRRTGSERERSGLRRVALPAVAVVITTAAVTAAVEVPSSPAPRHPRRAVVPASSGHRHQRTDARRGSGHRPGARPSDVTGTQQVLQEVTPDPLTDFNFPVAGTFSSVIPGTLHGFSVDGGITFDVANVVPSAPSGPTGGSGGTQQPSEEAWLGLYNPMADDDGSVGYQAEQQPIEPRSMATLSPVEVVNNWPDPDHMLFVWTELPAGTAYVTYSYAGATTAWEEPVDGTVGFEVTEPFPHWSGPHAVPYSVWHDSPLPLLTAYDASGSVLTQVKAPRISGDDEIVSP